MHPIWSAVFARRQPASGFAILILFGLVGCGSKNADPLVEVKKARAEAESAWQAKDASRAMKAAERAKKAAEDARKSADAADDETSRDRAVEAERLAAETVGFGELADEEKKLGDIAGSLKARAYRGTRAISLAALFEGLALAADQAAQRNPDELPEETRRLAGLAADLVHNLTGRAKRPDGQPDWSNVAGDLRQWRTTPPSQIGLLLAAGFVVSGRDELALLEIESVDLQKLRNPSEQAAHAVLRLLILNMLGFRRLAAQHGEIPGSAPGYQDSNETVGLAFCMLAAMAISARDFKAADLHLARAARACPNNPVTVYLTGERLDALGQRQQAEKSFEAAAAGAKDEWLARAIAQRVREVRDGKGRGGQMLMDASFLKELALRYVWEAASTSEAAARAKGLVETARGLADRLSGLPQGNDATPR